MLSIVILSYKNPATLRLCLTSLQSALVSSSLDYEIVVVDSATSPETQNVVLEDFKEKFTSIRLIPFAENTGYSRGVNEGLRAARGEYLLALNYDVIVPQGALEKLLDYFTQHPEVGLLGPELLNFNGTHQDSYFEFYTPLVVLYRRMSFLPFRKKVLHRFLMKDTDPRSVQEPDWISGSVVLTSQAALEKVGLLDEKLFHYFSDVDWAHRFWENGYKVVYYPGAQIFHYLGQSSKGKFWLTDALLKREARWHIKDGIRYFLKHGFLGKSHSVL